MKAKIHEIFKSIQGEGLYAGQPQVFVRFFGCHQNCIWCDTPDSWDQNKKAFCEYSQEDLLKKILSLRGNCRAVSLTGGEPLLQADFLKEFLPVAQSRFSPNPLFVLLETNGILVEQLKKVISFLDVVAMDVKLPSSVQTTACWSKHREFLEIAGRKEVFVKAVISMTTTPDDIIRAAQLVATFDDRIPFFLQPNFFDEKEEVSLQCIQFQKYCLNYLKDVRIVPQLHKLWGVR